MDRGLTRTSARRLRAGLGPFAAALALLSVLCAAAAEAAPPVTISGPGRAAGQVNSPEGASVDRASGELYVAEFNNRRISKFDSEGSFLLAWGFGVADNETAELQTCGPQASPPTLKCFAPNFSTDVGAGSILPESVAVDQSSHDVYVADAQKRRVTRFTAEGEFVFMIGKEVNKTDETDICTAADLGEGDECGAGLSGTEAEEFFGSPVSVLVDASGHLWVGDNARLLEFDSDGSFLSEAKVPPGGGGAVRGLGIDPTTAEPKSGHLYLKSDALAGVREYEISGAAPLKTLTQVGELDASGEPRALVLDAEGNVYVGDSTSPYRFKAYDSTGALFSQFGAGQVIGGPGASGGGSGSGGNPLALDEARGALYSVSSRANELSAVQRFTLPGPGPLPESPQSEEVLPSSATLTATLNPEGHETSYRFQYLTQADYEAQEESFEGPATLESPEQTLPGTAFESEEVSAAIDELLPDTAYRFRLAAANECEPGEQCATHSEDATFTTPTAVGIEAQWSEDVAASSVTFKAKLDPFGEPAEWRLEYGTDESYGNATPYRDLGSGLGAVEVGKQITGLDPDTLYHYRFSAKDVRDGTSYTVHGPDQAVLTAIGRLGFSLPDARAWEQVSPLRKGGGRVVAPWLGFTQAAQSGALLTYVSFGPISETAGSRFPEVSQSLARRGASGWSSQGIDPPHETAQLLANDAEYRLFSPDLARAALEPRGLRVSRPGPLSPEASEWTPYLRENLLEPPLWRPLVTGKEPFANVCAGTEFGGGEEAQLGSSFEPPIKFLGGSPDLGTAIVKASVPLTCDAEGKSGALYAWSGGALELISKLPGGEVQGAATLGSSPGTAAGSIRGAVSGDGRFAFWAPANRTALYARDALTDQTVRLDDPQPGSFGGADKPIFQGASADGRRAFFTDTRHLTPDASETGADLYECEIVEAGGKERCLLDNLTPETPEREAAEVQGTVTAIDGAGEDLYFVANGKLAPGAVAGDCGPLVNTPEQRCNLYHAHREGGSWSMRLVAVLSGADGAAWGGSNVNNSGTVALAGAASPSGRYLAFMSQLPLSGQESRDAESGEPAEQVFRYDSVGGELACVSCNPSGARPRAAIGATGYQLPSDWRGLWAFRRVAATLPDPQWPAVASPAAYRPRAMLDNGRVLFNAFDGLVAADSNGTADAYQYEPWGLGSCDSESKGPAVAQAQGGACVALLSAGTSQRESAVLDSSASGDDVFIITASQLSVLDEDSAYDIYDVRVGGAAATREAVSECLGEACQSVPAPPQAPTPPTAAPAGNGNVSAPARRCIGSARAAKRLALRARRARHAARRAQRRGAGRHALRMGRQARRLARRAKRRSSAAKRCRRRARAEKRSSR